MARLTPRRKVFTTFRCKQLRLVLVISAVSSRSTTDCCRCLTSFVFLIGTFRVNAFFSLTFFGLVFMFAFIAAAEFSIPSATTAADAAHIAKLLNIAGGFGFLGVICGWYLAILTACAAVGIPCPLPVFDLSSKVFPKKDETGQAS